MAAQMGRWTKRRKIMSNSVKTPYEIANVKVGDATKTTKIVAQEGATGTSYFEGKKRLLKVLKSKRDISIEINVELNATDETKYGLTKISAKTARDKHLGTMKYLMKVNDLKILPDLLKTLVANFKAEQIAEKAANDAKEQKAV